MHTVVLLLNCSNFIFIKIELTNSTMPHWYTEYEFMIIL